MALKICGELALIAAIASVFFVAAQGYVAERVAEESAGREYMKQLDHLMQKAKNEGALASWNYDSNITDHNQQVLLQTNLALAKLEKEYWQETNSYAWKEFQDEDLRRQFKKYSELGTAILPEDLNARLLQAISNMTTNYAKSTICDYHNSSRCDLLLDAEIADIFANSRDAEELKHAWLQWHDAAGKPAREHFTEYVALMNEAAKLNGYASVAEDWLSEYEDDEIEEQFAKLWEQVLPFYQQMHAYVRRNLRLKYGDDVVPAKGPIPAHLLGNMWAQTWKNVESFSLPFPDKEDTDITYALNQQGYTASKIFKTAEDFFVSLNLTAMPELFWERSIIERPSDGRSLVCHASAWDFFDGEDFRIKQCTTITDAFFKTTHHEMGHIQYYLQYKHQPVVYRAGANPGFHEAVGDVISLSVSTPKHLKSVGLMNDAEDDNESNINQLYKMGLEKIVFLPFGYMLDVYRYSIFRGATSPAQYNCHFWRLREALQGVAPPLKRSEDDFDAAAKYHVSADVEYMRYYVSYIVQFQFHRALCLLAGEYSEGGNQLLSNCDIYNSTAAGNALAQMLKMGSSKPWPDAMEALTGQRVMDASGLLEYFQPLYEWLKADNEKHGEHVGWEPTSVEYCTLEQSADIEGSDFQKYYQRFWNITH